MSGDSRARSACAPKAPSATARNPAAAPISRNVLSIRDLLFRKLDAMSKQFRYALIGCVAAIPVLVAAQRRGDPNPFPGGTNPDGSLRPTPPLTRLFTQDAYTEYAILAPGTEQFRIQFITEEMRAGSTELVNATRGGSEGSDIEVYDPRTGKPVKFSYQQDGDE